MIKNLSLFYFLFFGTSGLIAQSHKIDSIINILHAQAKLSNSSISDISRTVVFMTQNDTISFTYKVYKLRVNDSLSFYKILDIRNNSIYIKDSLGFSVFYPSTGLLLRGIEPPDIFKRYSFEYTDPQNINSLLLHRNVLTYNDNTLLLDSLLSPDKRSTSSIKMHIAEKENVIDNVITNVSFLGMHQYEEKKLSSYLINIPNIYDSIALAKQTITIKQERNIQEQEKVNKAQIENIIGKPIANLTYSNPFGKEVKIDTFHKVYIIDYHYKACYPCWVFSEKLNSLNIKYKNLGLKIYGINPIDPLSNSLKDFYSKKDVNYDILIGSNTITSTFSADTFPTIVILDSNHKIIKAWEGYSESNIDALENKLRELLNK